MQATASEQTIRRKRERAGKAPASALSKKHSSTRTVALGLLLVVGTIILYSPVRGHAFITYDDDEYVLNNPHITAGLSWQTVRWSLTATEQANWHPVTWLSHALDCQLFGLNPGDHHLSNVVIHALNVLLLFLLLQQATGAVGCSFLVAAVSAWHPFNVGSVAWVAERKNLLSTFFFFLTLGAYGWYARKPGFKRLIAVVGLFVLALAAKPMAVSLPFVLLLLDYWPLQRVSGWTEPSPRFAAAQQSVQRLLLEKVPLFTLSAASSAITIWAQASGKALRSLQVFPLSARVTNALYSYLIYIQKTFWPSGFAVYYPHPGTSLSLWKPALAAVLLSAVSVAVWKQRKIRPYLIVGWLWFLGTLFPVIGIVQVGDQAMADRHAYLPLIGLLIMIAWGTADLLEPRRVGTVPRVAFVCIALGALSALTYQQLGYWRDSVSLWSHALQETGGSVTVERQLGNSLLVLGKAGDALPYLESVASRDPNDIITHVNLGMCYLANGQLQKSIDEFQRAVALTDRPDLSADDRQYRTSALLDLGIALTFTQDYPNALLSFQRAYKSGPGKVDHAIQTVERSLATAPSEMNYLKLSLLQRAEGHDSVASSILKNAIQANPEDVRTRELLNYLNGAGK